MPDRPSYGELADALWSLRKITGMSAQKVAGLANRSQPWLSRLERGKQVPTAGDIETLTGIYRAPASARRRLLALSRDLREDTTPPARMVIRRGADRMQRRIGRIEEASVRIANFYPILVPGLLQTEAYARAVFASGGDIPAGQQAAAVAERLARQKLLMGEGREFVFVMSEGVLRWPLGGSAVMAEQLEQLVERSRVPQVRVGVIPGTGAVDVAPMHGFDLYDQRAAVVGTETATAFLTNPHDVAAYVKLFAALEKAAVFGDEARVLLAELADGFRRMT